MKIVYLDLDNCSERQVLDVVDALNPAWYSLKKSSENSWHAVVLTDSENIPKNDDYQKVIDKRRKQTLRITRKVKI